VREEQDLDRDGQAGVQGHDDDEQDAGGLCVDGGDDGVSAKANVSIMIPQPISLYVCIDKTYKFLNKNTADIARPTPTKA